MSAPEVNALLLAETDFCLKLLKETAKEKSLVFSPLSISLALSLVHAGAKGCTRQQITQAICNGATDEEVLSHYETLSRSFQNTSEGVEINLANKMYISQDLPIDTTYLDLIQKHFHATAENLDFSDGAATATKINGFVSEITHGKINSIVEAEHFEDADDPVLSVLINALYMKGQWKDKFPISSTNFGYFQGKNGINRKVRFMHQNEVNRDYAENDEVQVLSLKYKDESYAFNIFLPKDKKGLASFREDLTASKMQEMLAQLSDTYVSIKLPKMKVESALELKDVLRKLGVTHVFSDSADLSGISSERMKITDVEHKAVIERNTHVFSDSADLSGISGKALKITDVEHKAVIELDEGGTVAAAVTRKITREITCYCSDRVYPKQFHADRPFIFSITFNKQTVFIGQLC